MVSPIPIDAKNVKMPETVAPIPIRCPVCGLPISTNYEEHCTCSESDRRLP